MTAKTILIVDDDRIFAKALGRTLENEGYIALLSHETHGALLSARENQVDCAIIDYNPPNPTNDTKWVSLYGESNRVEYSHFRGKANVGATLVVWVSELPDPNHPNHHPAPLHHHHTSAPCQHLN